MTDILFAQCLSGRSLHTMVVHYHFILYLSVYERNPQCSLLNWILEVCVRVCACVRVCVLGVEREPQMSVFKYIQKRMRCNCECKILTDVRLMCMHVGLMRMGSVLWYTQNVEFMGLIMRMYILWMCMICILKHGCVCIFCLFLVQFLSSAFSVLLKGQQKRNMGYFNMHFLLLFYVFFKLWFVFWKHAHRVCIQSCL